MDEAWRYHGSLEDLAQTQRRYDSLDSIQRRPRSKRHFEAAEHQLKALVQFLNFDEQPLRKRERAVLATGLHESGQVHHPASQSGLRLRELSSMSTSAPSIPTSWKTDRRRPAHE